MQPFVALLRGVHNALLSAVSVHPPRDKALQQRDECGPVVDRTQTLRPRLHIARPRRGDTDGGTLQFGGNTLFREIVQHSDGTLGAKFPAELTPTGVPVAALQAAALDATTRVDGRSIHMAAQQGLSAADCAGIPFNARLTLRVHPQANARGFGLRFGGDGAFDSGYDLHFSPDARTATLQRQNLFAVDGLDRPFTLEVVLWNDIIDVCIDGRRTLVDRCPERRGSRLLVYAEDSDVAFEFMEMMALT